MRNRPRSVARRYVPFLVPVAILLVAIFVAFSGRAAVRQAFDRQTEIQQAQVTLESMLRELIFEESAVRGFTGTRDAFYKQQYDASLVRFRRLDDQMRGALVSMGLSEEAARLGEYEELQANWRATVADPSFAHPGRLPDSIDRDNKLLTDSQGQVAEGIRTALKERGDRLASAALARVTTQVWANTGFFVAFFLAALWVAWRLARSDAKARRAIDVAQTLQGAFASTAALVPHCVVGSAYAAASSDVTVGGDVFDLFQLSDTRALAFVADVSGKGVHAAVLTSFIKMAIRSVALRRTDPGKILAELNTTFAHTYTAENPTLFVSMFVGIIDTDRMYVEYASGGHDSAFVRRSSGVQQLAVTGPVLGVMEEPFETRTVRIEDGDVLVLATDGLTEARYPNGELLYADGAMQLIAQSSEDPQRMADQLVAKVRALGGNRMRDDLAILAVRVYDPRERADA